MSTLPEIDASDLLRGERIALVGKLGGMTQREASQLIRQQGATVVEKSDATATLIVLGDESFPLGEVTSDSFLNRAQKEATERGDLEIINETQLWQRLGFVEAQQNIQRLYTPAMLADLLDVSVAVVRRWHRKGLIVPVREVQRLPYFDFQEVTTARRLVELLAAGCSPHTIEKKLAELRRYVPGVDRPLAQLSVIVEGKQLLLRQGAGLVEPGGQLRIDFEAPQPGAEDKEQEDALSPSSILLAGKYEERLADFSPEEMFQMAVDLEDEGQLEAASEMYRATLVAGGPNAEVDFALAEVLYRMDDVSAARERYYAAIELDEDYVEARANLGCVLAETGQLELAVAAFQGALTYHDEYPDVHYHLARTLDQLGRAEEALEHWSAFLLLSPSSPWAEEARERLAGDLTERASDE